MNNLKILVMISVLPFVISFNNTDPTRPPGTQVLQVSPGVQKQKLKLQGMVNGAKPWVVINDMVFKPGETKKGITVIQLKSDKVLVLYRQKKQWLPWRSLDVKHSAQMKLK